MGEVFDPVVMRHGLLSAGERYTEDEVYVVLAGVATLRTGNDDLPERGRLDRLRGRG